MKITTIPICSWSILIAAAIPASAQTDAPVFERDIYPIFAKKCAGCHFPDLGNTKGDLDLSTAATTMEGGETGQILLAGKPGESLLVASLEHTREPHMPPPDKFEKLDVSAIAIIRNWIETGAQSDPSIATAPPQLPDPASAATLERAAAASIAFAPNGDPPLLAEGTLGRVRIYEVASDTGAHSEVATLDGHAEMVRALAFSSDGKVLAAAGGAPGRQGEIKLWSTETWTELRTITGHRDNVLDVAFDSSGERIATGSYDNTAFVWNVTNGEPVLTLKDHVDAVYAVAFSPDGKQLATGSGDRAVKIWNAETGRMIATITNSLAEVYALAYSPDGTRLAAAGEDKMIRVYEVPTGETVLNQSDSESVKLLSSSFAHDGAVLQLAYAPSGETIYSSGNDLRIKAWDASKLTEEFSFEQQPDWPMAIGVSHDGALLATGRYDSSIGIYHAQTGLPFEADAVAVAQGVEVVAASERKKVTSLDVQAVIIRATVPPSFNSMSPDRSHRGVELTLDVNGKNLDRAKPIFTAPGAVVEIIESEAGEEPSLELGEGPRGTGADILDNARPYKLKVKLTLPEDVPVGTHQLLFETPIGLTNSRSFTVIAAPDIAETEPNNPSDPPQSIAWPAVVSGRIQDAGDVDRYAVTVKAGQELVFALTDSSLNARLQLMEMDGSELANSVDMPGDATNRLGYRFERDGDYILQVADVDLRGGLGYRLHVGEFPWVTRVWPLGVQTGEPKTVAVEGFNLGAAELIVDPPDEAAYDARIGLPIEVPQGSPIALPTLAVGTAPEVMESEPNDDAGAAQAIAFPGTANGRFESATDVDCYRFTLKAGETIYLETQAARLGSPVDTFIDILTPSGELLERGVVRCVAQTQLTLADRDSRGAGFRLASWGDLAMGDYVLAGSEIVRVLALPDYGDEDVAFVAYPNGQRKGFFATTPEHHAVNAQVYKVEIHPPGSTFAPNGMQSFPLYWRNDDGFFGDGDASGDSFIEFIPPEDGDYIVRVREVRGLGGPDRAYRLVARRPEPNFDVIAGPYRVNIAPGSRIPIDVRVRRVDGFDGRVRVSVHDLPEGFSIEPGVVLEGEDNVKLALVAANDAVSTAFDATYRIVAESEQNGEPVTKETRLGSIHVSEVKPDLVVANGEESVNIEPGKSGWISVRLDRFNEFNSRVPIDVLNLPYGVRVLDTGLNGILVREGEFDRRMEIYVEPWVPAMTRDLYVQARIETQSPMQPTFLGEPIQLVIGSQTETVAAAQK